MPSLGADMEAATVVRWLVKPGDRVKRGQVVAEVESEKGVLEIEVFEDGVVERIVVPEGQKVAVGTLLATIGAPGAASQPAAPSRTQPEAPRARRKISPAARALADTLGLDVEAIDATGPDSVVTLKDVRRAAGGRESGERAGAAAPDAYAEKRRVAIATLMARSKREIPHYYLSTDIDLHAASAWLEARNAERPLGDRMLPAALLLKAVATALGEVPEMNGFFADGAFHPSTPVHLGVAISLHEGGLVAPAIHDADRKSLAELMSTLRDLVRRARAGVLRASEMSAPTITVTNLGERGVETVFGVIYPPQVALVGFGKIVQRPRVADGVVVARPVVAATLSGDHRVSDGHRGALFLAAVDRVLQTPEAL
jgi:pyruvate dehydrogenase E2 component (dihydrolipoamide acetyltransferase)